MKNSKSIRIVCLLLMLSGMLPVFGENFIRLDPDLKANSTPMEAKRKAITTFPKYQFGPYAIVSAKAGWTIGKSTTKPRFFLEDTNSESKTRSSFVLVVKNDTVTVNTVNKVFSNETRLGNISSTNQTNGVFTANLQLLSDSSEWQVKLTTEMGAQVAGSFNMEGELTNGIVVVQIRPVKLWDSGKMGMFNMILGYELVLNNQSIAAVQSPQMTTKRIVWLRENLDEHLKTILATTSALLMIRSDMLAADGPH